MVYIADQQTVGVFELYVRAIDGSGSTIKLSYPQVSGGNVDTFILSPDSSRVIYRADQNTDGVNELYSVPLPM